MEKKYDIWIDYDYEGWHPEWGLDTVELAKSMEGCHNRKQSYVVYDCSGMVIEHWFQENER